MMRLGYTAFALVLVASPAAATLPDAVRAMLEAAIKKGDAGKVATVAEFARELHPDAKGEIDVLVKGFEERRKRLAAEDRAQKEAEIRRAGMFQHWSGEGEVGLIRTTGNNRQTGVTGGLELDRVGIDWTHKIIALADYQENAGKVSRERYSLAYEPRYNLSKLFFLSGLAKYEHDRFQGYDSRYSLSGGFGYRFIDRPDLKLAFESGPAVRLTDFTDESDQINLAARYALDVDWSITDRVKLSEDASAILQFGNDTLFSRTSLEASLSERLSTRLSYLIEHDTEPPGNAAKTDTRTNFTLIYGF